MYLSLGLHSPLLAQARELRSKKGRSEQHAYLVEGPTLLREAVDSGVAVEAVFGLPDALRAAGGTLARAGAPVYELTPAALGRITELTTSPGLVARIALHRPSLDSLLDGGGLLALAGVADPGNAGTLMRTAEAFGLRGVVFAGDSVEPYNPKVVRAAMGSLFRLPPVISEPDELIAAARRAGYRIVATGHNGIPLPAYRFSERSIVAIGNERRGVAAVLPEWDDMVTIPQPGGGESLNAAVAGAIILYAYSLSKNIDLSSLGGP